MFVFLYFLNRHQCNFANFLKKFYLKNKYPENSILINITAPFAKKSFQIQELSVNKVHLDDPLQYKEED